MCAFPRAKHILQYKTIVYPGKPLYTREENPTNFSYREYSCQEPTISTRGNQQRRILISTKDNPTILLQHTLARALECLASTSAPQKDKPSTCALLSYATATATTTLLQTCVMYQCESVSNEEGVTFIYTNLSSDFSSRADLTFWKIYFLFVFFFWSRLYFWSIIILIYYFL
jgi:hypothetical protein